MEEKGLVKIEQDVQNKFLQLIHEDYPVQLREGVNEVLDIINQEKSITDLYPQVMAEIPLSQSLFQDQCVQYEQHHTPHRKLRQCMLEMQDRLNALYTAKTGHKKAILKVKRFEFELENIQEQIDLCDLDMKSSSEDTKEYRTAKKDKLRLVLSKLEKETDLEEAQRGVKTAAHLVKDAMTKVVHQRELVNMYEKEVEESGLSFEEAEVIYYTMYFTADAEKQLRTGDHQIDRGTFGVIAQLPKPIRMKVLKNINFMRNKLFDKENPWPMEGDYLHIVHRDELLPKKTGEGEFEGMLVKDFLRIDTAKLLSK